jgi:hypothetical protein
VGLDNCSLLLRTEYRSFDSFVYGLKPSGTFT